MPGSLELHPPHLGECAWAAFGQTFSSRCQTARRRPEPAGEFVFLRTLYGRASPSTRSTKGARMDNGDTGWRHHERSEWWSQTGSNRRPHACKARALPTELWPRDKLEWSVVGPGRVELPTSRLSGVRSNHLSYGPPDRRSRLPKAPRPVEERPDQEQPDLERLRPRRKRNEDGGVPPKWPCDFRA